MKRFRSSGPEPAAAIVPYARDIWMIDGCSRSRPRHLAEPGEGFVSLAVNTSSSITPYIDRNPFAVCVDLTVEGLSFAGEKSLASGDLMICVLSRRQLLFLTRTYGFQTCHFISEVRPFIPGFLI